MKRIAMYPGSFDPITNGHVDIIERSLRIFDEIHIVIAENPRKVNNAWFPIKERLEHLKKIFAKEPRIKADSCDGLIMDYAHEHKIRVVVRGLRAVGDFENEFMMATINRNLNSEVETIFMATGQSWFFVSSSILKEVISFGGDVSEYVPPVVVEALKAKK